MKYLFVLVIIFSGLVLADLPFQTINFPSKDSLEITADLYSKFPHNAPFIILFHQAGFSRGEYRAIAPELNNLGFNAMAIDQRSGKEANSVVNETVKRAAKKNLPDSYLNALQDMEAAINFVKNNYANQKVIIWGSSYSAALALKIAGDHPNLVDGVLAFSPGEYFERLGKSPTFIQESVKNLQIPVFITSGKAEKNRWWAIYNSIPSQKRSYFLPKTKGIHGSRALWESTPEHSEYWVAVKKFLQNFIETKPPAPPKQLKYR